MRRFVSCAIEPSGEGFLTPATGNEPPLPAAFRWEDRTLVVAAVRRAWRTSKNDRGDDYLKRHWFEIETGDGSIARVYYDREARRGAARWWLYTIEEPD